MSDFSKIERIPEVPQKIIDAVNDKKLVVFIGAGVSRIIGCMGWDQLASNLVNICYSTPKTNGEGNCIGFKEKETLDKDYNHKKVITICHHILCIKNNLEDLFYEQFNNSLIANPDKIKQFNIYKEIFGLRGINLTTNADKHFDEQYLDCNRIFEIEEFPTDSRSIERIKLYQIHGSQDKRDSLVFRVPEYITRYNNQHFKKFLENIFLNHTVLFVGYGMSEFELLDFLITKYDTKSEVKELRHFLLMPFYKGEENILNFEQSYYNTMGVNVIGYEKDENGFNQLYHVIKHWNSEINKTSLYIHETYEQIDNLLEGL